MASEPEPVDIIGPLKATRMLLDGSAVLVRREEWERLTARLAERDAEVARLVGAAQAYIDAYDAALKAPLQYAQAEEYCHAQRYNLRAALAARGGEGQG